MLTTWKRLSDEIITEAKIYSYTYADGCTTHARCNVYP